MHYPSTLKVRARVGGQFSSTDWGFSPPGNMLALVTGDSNENHYLQLYDVRASNPQATVTHKLEPFVFPPRLGGLNTAPPGHEHSCVVFSPDGMYLALARSDNQTHLYDVRMLNSEEQGLLCKYRHETVDSETSHYGIVRAHWLTEERTGYQKLLTGGDDGCVRMWNPSQSSSNNDACVVVAEVSCAVADFTVGDRFKGEHELVVSVWFLLACFLRTNEACGSGDSGGTLYLYDGRGKPLFSA